MVYILFKLLVYSFNLIELAEQPGARTYPVSPRQHIWYLIVGQIDAPLPVFAKHLSNSNSSSNRSRQNLRIGQQANLLRRDSDFDGLSDGDEILFGTDLSNPDSDGDALKDGWEVNGLNGVNLRQLGASPLKKDIFVEMDYMVRRSAKNGLGPSKSVISRLEQIFAAAPVDNPDGSLGINLHLLLGNEIRLDTLLHPYRREFLKIKKNNFNDRWNIFCHYMIWADSYLNEDGESNSSGNAFINNSSDFFVTLGKWENGMGGTDNQKVGTFMHELGHNLGLRHGGLDDVPRKPNHISVMNWLHQEYGVALSESSISDTLLFTYQWFDLPILKEDSLEELHGLGSNDELKGLKTKFYSTRTMGYEPCIAFGSIDWDSNNKIDNESLIADLNGDSLIQNLTATKNEWQLLKFHSGVIGGTFRNRRDQNKSILPKLPPITELTENASQKFSKY